MNLPVQVCVNAILTLAERMVFPDGSRSGTRREIARLTNKFGDRLLTFERCVMLMVGNLQGIGVACSSDFMLISLT
jgi:hypothetical protein